VESMEVEPCFWVGKRVFVTGHTGFKGSWLSLWLHRLGAKVTGYALTPPTDPSLFELARVRELVTSYEADVRDFPRLVTCLRESRAEMVIHMAAQSLVRESYKGPLETYEVNVMGTANVLQAVRDVGGVKAVLVVTSDKCYENKEWCWGYRESDPMGGHDPYSSSKGCAELVTAAYRRSFFDAGTNEASPCAVATARAGNVIGGGDWAVDRLVPDALRDLIAERPIRVRSPRAVRPWQHVLDPLSGYLLLLQLLYERGASLTGGWNFGPTDESVRSVGDVVQMLVAAWGEGKWKCDEDAKAPHEATLLKLDSSRARTLLGWQPKLDLETAVSRVAAWTRAYQREEDMRMVTDREIQAYMALPG